MDLTEYQVDRLTDAFSSGVGSPYRGRTSTTDRLSSEVVTRSSIAASANSTGHTHDASHSRMNAPKNSERVNELADARYAANDKSRHPKDRPDLPCGSPGQHRVRNVSRLDTLAKRRNVAKPDNIKVNESTKHGTYVHRASTVPTASHPLTNYPQTKPPLDEEISSLYSQETSNLAPDEGLSFVGGDTVSQKIEDIIQGYSGWTAPRNAAYFLPMQPPPSSPVRPSMRPRGKSPCRRADTKVRAEALKDSMAGGAAYSPLMTYFAFEGVPVQKLGGKTMIGHHGWLERPTAGNTDQTDQSKKGFSPKKLGLLDSIKKMAKDMTPIMNGRRPRDTEKAPKVSRITISLNPREQSLLYCELEFHVSNALHAYVTNELSHGRLDPNKLKKIADGWSQKGRPKVIGFRYDLETQLELIDLHIEDFRFFGRRQGNPVEITGLLHAMKVNARAIRVRTFCQPDSVVAKQLVDSQSLFNTIGCSEGQQIALAEIAQFFKVIVERERLHRDRIYQSDDRAAPSCGQETHPGTPWEPQSGNDNTLEETSEVHGGLTRTEHDHGQKYRGDSACNHRHVPQSSRRHRYSG